MEGEAGQSERTELESMRDKLAGGDILPLQELMGDKKRSSIKKG